MRDTGVTTDHQAGGGDQGGEFPQSGTGCRVRRQPGELGGHIASFASSATLYEHTASLEREAAKELIRHAVAKAEGIAPVVA